MEDKNAEKIKTIKRLESEIEKNRYFENYN